MSAFSTPALLLYIKITLLVLKGPSAKLDNVEKQPCSLDKGRNLNAVQQCLKKLHAPLTHM